MKSITATISADGRIELDEKVSLPHPCRAIVTIIEEEQSSETALLSGKALAEDWNRPEEDEAWSHLQRGR